MCSLILRSLCTDDLLKHENRFVKRIVYEKDRREVNRLPTNDSEWYNEWQRVTTSGTASDNEWQRVTTSDNQWQRVTKNNNEWQRMRASDKTNEYEWE